MGLEVSTTSLWGKERIAGELAWFRIWMTVAESLLFSERGFNLCLLFQKTNNGSLCTHDFGVKGSSCVSYSLNSLKGVM